MADAGSSKLCRAPWVHSATRVGWTLFGMTRHPFCRPQRSSTCASAQGLGRAAGLAPPALPAQLLQQQGRASATLLAQLVHGRPACGRRPLEGAAEPCCTLNPPGRGSSGPALRHRTRCGCPAGGRSPGCRRRRLRCRAAGRIRAPPCWGTVGAAPPVRVEAWLSSMSRGSSYTCCMQHANTAPAAAACCSMGAAPCTSHVRPQECTTHSSCQAGTWLTAGREPQSSCSCCMWPTSKLDTPMALTLNTREVFWAAPGLLSQAGTHLPAVHCWCTRQVRRQLGWTGLSQPRCVY